MALDDTEAPDVAARHRQRREKFAGLTAERLRATEDCQFSLLPFDELARVTGNWYEACAQAMLRGNYSPIDELVRDQARVAAEQGFQLEDVMQLLRLCRRTAIEVEGWNEDQFADVDAIIDEAFAYLRNKVPWDIPDGLNYMTGRSRAAPPFGLAAEQPHGERRTHARNRLRLPIRIQGALRSGKVDEMTHTANVARGGLYFISSNPYTIGLTLTITYPYWEGPGAINKEYPARIVRVDAQADGRRGVAVKFLVSLERASL